MKMKIQSALLIAGGLALSACKPSQLKPPFDYNHIRQDTKVEGVQLKAESPLNLIGVPSLWKKTTGKNADGSRVKIALVGSGIDYTIPDLRDALWINYGEADEKSRNNGLDNDGNGYKNDVFGMDFSSGDNMPYDWHGHDTFTASLIAATGKTNPAVIGVAPNAELVVARYINSDGRGTGLDALEALEYAVATKSKIVYFNWPQGGFAPSEVELLLGEFKKLGTSNILIVMPAGNSGNKSVPEFIKEAGKLSNVIVVAGLDAQGRIARNSNSGREFVTTAAPAVNATAYLPGGQVTSDLTTTSVAAAYVTGAAALISTLPGMGSVEKIKLEVLARSDARRGEDGLDVLSNGQVDLTKF